MNTVRNTKDTDRKSEISNGVKDIIFELKKKLMESVGRNKASGLLFSGGLDSSILAGIISDINTAPRCRGGVKAITVNLGSYGDDIGYAKLVAKFFNMEHYQRIVDINEAIEAIPEVIKILKTFDPAIPNDIVVYFGLKQAKEMGIKEVMTGDGSDELFAGYSFMKEMDALDDYIKRISSSLQFSSNEFGKFFDIIIKQPYLDKELINFCFKITKELKIKNDNDRIWGKWILRKAFEDMLPKEVIWQDKRPLECGSGMVKIREVIDSRVRDNEFKKICKSSLIKFMSKEHYYYYRIYRDVIGDIPKPKHGEKECPCCGTGINPNTFHCKLCGKTVITT